MVLLSLVLAGGVAAFVGLRGDTRSDQTLPMEPRATGKPAEEKREYNPGKKLEIDDKPSEEEPRQEEPRQEKPQPESRSEPRPQPRSEPRSEPRRPEALQTSVADWPRPTQDELDSARAPRYFAPEPDEGMTLTVEALGLYDVPVISSDSLEALDRGVMHVPETSLPWDGGAQRNVYLAGHYLGYPNTGSRLVFYDLDKLGRGDEVFLDDGQGRVYTYRVSESFTAGPEDSWVMGQVRDRDMVTLQTCVPPTFEDRLVVRADRV